MDSKTKSIVDSGLASVNNSDTDLAGNEIKTVQPEIDLTNTNIEKGHYTLSFFVTLTNGETDILSVPCEVVDLREV